MTGLSVGAGIFSGLAAATFLVLLNWATETRLDHPAIVWGLPLAGWLIASVYHTFGRDSAPGTNLVLDEIHAPSKTLPVAMAPLILLSTVLTHLFGGSAGREGTVVQMGASLADQLGRHFTLEPDERRGLLTAGAGAGFGAALGAPFAGAIFGLEMVHARQLRLKGLLYSVVAALVAYLTVRALPVPRENLPSLMVQNADLNDYLFVALAGLAFGLTARLFVKLVHLVEKIFAKWIRNPLWRPVIGGALILAGFALEGSLRYAGLGLDVISQALAGPTSFRDPTLKIVFTALTVGTGFKGGEFVPLVFIGATLGSALSQVLPVSVPILASVGSVAVFGAAANTPVACTLMAVELYGLDALPFALAGCFVAYLVSAPGGIYKNQKTGR